MAPDWNLKRTVGEASLGRGASGRRTFLGAGTASAKGLHEGPSDYGLVDCGKDVRWDPCRVLSRVVTWPYILLFCF